MAVVRNPGNLNSPIDLDVFGETFQSTSPVGSIYGGPSADVINAPLYLYGGVSQEIVGGNGDDVITTNIANIRGDGGNDTIKITSAFGVPKSLVTVVTDLQAWDAFVGIQGGEGNDTVILDAPVTNAIVTMNFSLGEQDTVLFTSNFLTTPRQENGARNTIEFTGFQPGFDRLVFENTDPSGVQFLDLDYAVLVVTQNWEMTVFITGQPHSVAAVAASIQFIAGPVELTQGEAVSMARLYNAGFGRDFDVDGLNYWIDRSESGVGKELIAEAFLDSSEFTTRFGDDDLMSNRQFVEVMYRNVLKRDGEVAGISYWASEMDQGLSRERVLMSFAESTENVANTSRLGNLVEVRDGYWDLA